MHDHLQRYLATNGEDGHIIDLSKFGGGKVPTLVLTAKGRRSGKPFMLPLIYGETGGNYVVIASKGGHPKHPAWFLNLLAEPRVEIQVKDKHLHAISRVAEGDERAKLWRMMQAIYKPYDEYQAKTQRQIPVVVLEPRKS
jgi:proline iminopeptidase